MAKLFPYFFIIFFLLISAPGFALSALCPAPPIASTDNAATMPEASVLHQAMQDAKRSAKRLDWVSAPSTNACGGYYLTPSNPSSEKTLEPEYAKAYLSADTIEQNTDGSMQLSGNVELYQGGHRLACQALYFNPNTGIKSLSGDIQIRQNGVLLMAEKAELNEALKTSELSHARYLLAQQMIRGSAEKIAISQQGNTLITLDDASLSLCPEDKEYWAFYAKSIELDKNKGWGTLRSAVLKVKNVPIAYIPYLNFPIDDRRKTGILWPSIAINSDRLDFALPIYFNLAPNYDLTYTPRLLTQHGLMHNAEFRYKQRYSEWQMGGSFIPNDRRVNDVKVSDDKSLDGKRWLGFLKQQGQFGAYWSSHINYQAVSDIDYFRDWGTTGLDVQKSLNIKRDAAIGFHNSDWDINATIVDYQTLEQDALSLRRKTEDYRLWPQINVTYLNRLRHLHVEPLLQAQYSYFDHNTRLVGQRLFIAPGLSLPLRFSAFDIIPSVKIKALQYSLKSDNTVAMAHEVGGYYHGQHGVYIPTFSLDSHLYFERLSGNSSSTLTPRLFYYYADYKKQEKLPNFDTTLTPFSYQQLWREERFSGFDRISDANQLSLGLSNNWAIDGRSVVDLGIGQQLYFADRKVAPSIASRQYQVINPTDSHALKKQKQQINRSIDKIYYRSSSDIASQIAWYINPKNTLRSEWLYDPYSKKFSEAALAYQFKDDKQHIINLAYRYQFQPLTVINNQSYKKSVDQVSGSIYWPVNPEWTLYHSSNYDISQRKYIASVSGLQYQGCCFTVMLAHKRERRTFDENMRIQQDDPIRYRNYWYIQFELKGLGGITNVISRLLEETIQGYQP